MSFSAYIRIITAAVAAVGIAAVSLVETIGAGFIALAIAAAAAAIAVGARPGRMLPKTLWNALAIVAFVVYVYDYTSISGSLVVSSTRFLTILVILKLFDLRTTRDYILLYSLVFFQVLAAATSTVSPLFFAVLSVFIMCVIWAMVIFSIKTDWEEYTRGRSVIRRNLFGPGFFAATVALAAAAIFMTLSLFFIIPRMGVGFFQAKTLNTLKVTGFTERVDLGDIGPVKTSTAVVMRVELPQRTQQPPGLLYFRGTALDSYDGTGWDRTLTDKRLIQRGPAGRYSLRGPGGDLLEQKILLEPLETEVLFAASRAAQVKGRFAGLFVDGAGSIYLPSPPYARIEYTAWSDLSGKIVEPQTTAKNPYLGLPETLDLERLRALASTITQGSTTDMEKALAIKSHLGRGFSYTLNPASTDAANPLEDFLFNTREGYCEHYATAMAILLRFAGIPSRIVTGFLQGEWNEFGNYFLVRQQDAHSWVEAYISNAGGDSGGWMRFDPTPAAGLSAPTRAGRLSMFLDSLRWRWTRHIISYTSSDQMRIAQMIEVEATRLRYSLKRMLASLTTGKNKDSASPDIVLIAIVTLGAVFIGWALWAAMLKKGLKSARTPPYYTAMTGLIIKRGYLRGQSETPMELAQRVGFAETELITRAFERERYGRYKLTAGELSEIDDALTALREKVKRHPSRPAKPESPAPPGAA